MSRFVAIFTLLCAAACSKERLGGIEVTLRFEPSSPARCARVYVTRADGRVQKPSNPLVRNPARDLSVGVVQTIELGDDVTIEAHGYEFADCSGPWIDDSNVVQKSFVRGSVLGEVLLVLDGRPVTNSDGGVEICDNAVDDDADLQADCKDFDCDGKSCGAPNFCSSFTCGPATTELDCANGADDDGNGKKDCEDDACAGRACRGTDPCKAQVCTAHACGGAAVVCPQTPPGSCQVAGSGTCGADGGCTYAARTGPCGDAGTCTAAGACAVVFPFTPHNVPRELPEAQLNGPLDIAVSCAATLDSDTGQWPAFCPGQARPTSLVLNQPGGAPVLRVIALRSLSVSGSITITGALPVAFAVLGDASIAGRIDASADGGLGGAGAPAGTGCGAGEGSPGTVGTPAGGGGAGFGGSGERGGHANNTNNTGGAKGVQSSDTDLSPLRGGCRGGIGGASGVAAAEGGGGGGAFQLTVAGTLTLTGKLVANGAGGKGGPARFGGGGGGSGGGILLEATTVRLNGDARVLTNAGAGGAGGDNGSPGDPGEDGDPNDPGRAQGGSGPGGPGGDAQDDANAAQRGSDAPTGSSGGGGGGAGMGRIVIYGLCTQGQNVGTAPSVPGSVCTVI